MPFLWLDNEISICKTIYYSMTPRYMITESLNRLLGANRLGTKTRSLAQTAGHSIQTSISFFYKLCLCFSSCLCISPEMKLIPREMLHGMIYSTN